MAISTDCGPLMQLLNQEKELIWSQHAHRSERERQHLWSSRQAELVALIGTSSRSGNEQSLANVPRSVSTDGLLMARHSSSQAPTSSMTAGQNLSYQSIPEAVSMSRVPSSFPTSNDAFSLDSSCTSFSGTDWYDSNSNYVLDSSNPTGQSYRSSLQTMPQLNEVNVDVYDNPSDYLMQMGDANTFCGISNNSFSPSEWGYSPESISPATPASVDLTSGSTSTSQLSRQSSLAASSSNDAMDMVRIQSTASNFSSHFPVDGELSPIVFSSSEKANGSAITLEQQRSRFLSMYNASREQALDASRSFPSTGSVQQPAQNAFPFSSEDLVVEDMNRSLSDESNVSLSSLNTRAQRRRQEAIAHGARPIAPKASDLASPAVKTTPSPPPQPSSHQMLRIDSSDGTSKHVAAITKAPYVRPHHPKIMCKHCNDHPDGFRGEHELRRHTDRVHARMRKVWVTVDVSPDKKFLASCKACRSGKRYGVYYNAAAHLRRAHFAPRKRGRKNKGDEKRGGKAGGDWPPMDWLKAQGWLQEVEELVPDVGEKGESEEEAVEEVADDMVVEPSSSLLQQQQPPLALYAGLAGLQQQRCEPLPESIDQFNDFGGMQFDSFAVTSRIDSTMLPQPGFGILDAHAAAWQ
ncbi:MAG: hypothetical protein M1820_010481 [Bogoriella megaspora]|nr:MAG: hypothetical protein M1820_010481 [Bogoriella megaspora]